MSNNKSTPKPLVLDVDGTFLRTDMLMESFWQALGRNPINCLRICATRFTDRAALKQELAALAPLRTDLLPVNPEIAALARHSKAQGRPVVFASGSDQSLVRQLAKDHDINAPVYASDGTTNLTGARKAKELVAAYGKGGFDYAGDGAVDQKVWDEADRAIVVGNHTQITKTLVQNGTEVDHFAGGWTVKDLLKALRPHQWVKNIEFFNTIGGNRTFAAGARLT